MISTGHAGNHHAATVNPGLHSHARYKEPVTVPTELSSQFARNAYPFFHGNTAGKRDTPVTPFRIFREEPGSLCEKDLNAFSGNMTTI